MLDRKQFLPRLTAVTDEQLAEINRIHFSFPYNFGPTPDPRTKTTLAEHIRDCEKEFPYAIQDLVDKLKLHSFSAESFDHHIDRNLLATPGYLSAVTVAKLIHYCLLILESEAEMITWTRIERGVPGAPDAHDIANAMAAKVNRYKDPNRIPEYDHLGQFLSAVKHPIIGRAVYHAAANRWGLSEQCGIPTLY
ncbi:MAG: hypothetical protein JO066_06775 [Verrucomicrobia bacterium]|nr:hypothetical protein [Verrucomicrobiota bacterium]MBV9298664.1 hypothetical protein [Verrucomicrobiota bacterium]